jgi:quercetin dioxygenase-like cupin family protein
MNILASIPFNPDKPATLVLSNTDSHKLIAVGLIKDQLLPQHQTPTPAFLTVLEGAIDFEIEGKKIRLNRLDTFEIPVRVMHEVKGVEGNNVFTLLLAK